MTQEQKKSVKGKIEVYYANGKLKADPLNGGKFEKYYDGNEKPVVSGPFDMNTEEGQRKAMEALLNSRKRGR